MSLKYGKYGDTVVWPLFIRHAVVVNISRERFCDLIRNVEMTCQQKDRERCVAGLTVCMYYLLLVFVLNCLVLRLRSYKHILMCSTKSIRLYVIRLKVWLCEDARAPEFCRIFPKLLGQIIAENSEVLTTNSSEKFQRLFHISFC